MAIDVRAYGDGKYQDRILDSGKKSGFNWGKKYSSAAGGQVHLDTGPKNRKANDIDWEEDKDDKK